MLNTYKREGRAPWLRHSLGIFTYIFVLNLNNSIAVPTDVFNQFMQNGLFYLNPLDRSITDRRDHYWLAFIITMFYKSSST